MLIIYRAFNKLCIVGLQIISCVRTCLGNCRGRATRMDTSELDRLMISVNHDATSKFPIYQDDFANQDPFQEAGNTCTICSSDTRFNTHFAFPCHHAACEECWKTWLQERHTCMICGDQVASVHRFSPSVLNSSPWSQLPSPTDDGSNDAPPKATMHKLNKKFEAAFTQLVHEMVEIKAKLREVKIINHIFKRDFSLENNFLKCCDHVLHSFLFQGWLYHIFGF
mmetsp:Transcript_48518/g.128339  ORF Transcript_48518/g.128339 Transcript_48518/m.128339 type:complete len:224 (+) Transcript_48518:41-712(+)